MTIEELQKQINKRWSQAFMELNSQEAYREFANIYKKKVTDPAWDMYKKNKAEKYNVCD